MHTSCARITQHISRTDNSPLQTPLTSLAHKEFSSPLALPVPSPNTHAATLEIVLLTNPRLTSRKSLLRLLNIMLRVENTSRADKGKLLRFPARAQFQRVNGSEDVRRFERRVGVHPVDQGAVVNHDVNALGKVIPEGLWEAELRLAQVAADALESGGPGFFPEAVGSAGGADAVQGLVGGFASDEGYDLGGGRFAGEEIAEDVSTEETGGTREEDDRFGGENWLGAFRKAGWQGFC